LLRLAREMRLPVRADPSLRSGWRA